MPTVGPLQGLAATIAGEANPAVSPRTEEVKFISRHAFPLIAGSVVAAVAVLALTLILLLLFEAAAFRRPTTWPHARTLVLGGGVAVALASIAHEVVYAIETHNFATGHDFTRSAVDSALTKGTANQLVAYLSLYETGVQVNYLVPRPPEEVLHPEDPEDPFAEPQMEAMFPKLDIDDGLGTAFKVVDIDHVDSNSSPLRARLSFAPAVPAEATALRVAFESVTVQVDLGRP